MITMSKKYISEFEALRLLQDPNWEYQGKSPLHSPYGYYSIDRDIWVNKKTGERLIHATGYEGFLRVNYVDVWILVKPEK